MEGWRGVPEIEMRDETSIIRLLNYARREYVYPVIKEIADRRDRRTGYNDKALTGGLLNSLLDRSFAQQMGSICSRRTSPPCYC